MALDTPPDDDDITSHECYPDSDKQPPAKVFVDGLQIPVINDGVRTEVRMDEAMDLTRFSEVYFPGTWDGVRYKDAVDALDPNAANVYDPVDIQIRDYEGVERDSTVSTAQEDLSDEGVERDSTVSSSESGSADESGEFFTVHRGFVMGVGGGKHGAVEQRMTVGDVGQLLGGIPFNGQYNRDSEVFDAIQHIMARLEYEFKPELFDRVVFIERNADIPRGLQANDTDDDDSDDSTYALTSFGALKSIIDSSAETGEDALEGAAEWYFSSEKTFAAHKDSAADVLDWVSEHVDGIFYFEPYEENGIALVYDAGYTDWTVYANHVDIDADAATGINIGQSEQTQVYRNNALHEMRPVTHAVVKGRETGGEVPVATVRHDRLAKRAAVPQTVTEQTDSVDTLDGAITKAKNRLEDEVRNASLGKILAAPTPRAEPNTTVVSQPACGAEVERDTDPFTYDVVSVTHTIAAKDQDNQRRHQTEMRVSPTVRDSDLKVVDEETGYEQVAESTESIWERTKDLPGDIIGIGDAIDPRELLP